MNYLENQWKIRWISSWHVSGENYFRHMGPVLSRFDQHVVQNFAFVQLVKNYLKSAKYKLEPRKIGEHFDTLEQKCLDLTLKYFPSAALRIYLERFLGFPIINIPFYDWYSMNYLIRNEKSNSRMAIRSWGDDAIDFVVFEIFSGWSWLVRSTR